MTRLPDTDHAGLPRLFVALCGSRSRRRSERPSTVKLDAGGWTSGRERAPLFSLTKAKRAPDRFGARTGARGEGPVNPAATSAQLEANQRVGAATTDRNASSAAGAGSSFLMGTAILSELYRIQVFHTPAYD